MCVYIYISKRMDLEVVHFLLPGSVAGGHSLRHFAAGNCWEPQNLLVFCWSIASNQANGRIYQGYTHIYICIWWGYSPNLEQGCSNHRWITATRRVIWGVGNQERPFLSNVSNASCTGQWVAILHHFDGGIVRQPANNIFYMIYPYQLATSILIHKKEREYAGYPNWPCRNALVF